MIQLLVTLGLIFMALPSYSKSVRVLSCKAEDSGHFSDKGFRLNVLKNEDGSYKATFSDGMTTVNTLHTWKISYDETRSEIAIANLNKTDLRMRVLKKLRSNAYGLEGMAAAIAGELVVKPYGHPAKTLDFDSSNAACVFGKI